MDKDKIYNRLASNPFYKLSNKQILDLQVTTQELRSDDRTVVAPKVKRKKRKSKKTS